MKILLPVDGSDAAEAAVDFVCSLAEDNPVDVIIVMVVYEPVKSDLQLWATQWTEQQRQRAEKIIELAKQSLESHCQSVSTVRETGSIVPCILDLAKKSKADLIVLGAKDHSAVHRVALGSVSDTVATRAECSVVVIRSSKSEKHQLDSVLIAFDKSVASREAVTELMQLKLSHDARIRVVSIAQTPYIYVGDGYVNSPKGLTPDQIVPISEAAERIASQISDHFPQTQSVILVADHVGDAIIEAANAGKADIILVGDASRSWVGEFFLGSTCKHVLRHAPCSVWISRHHWKTEGSKKEPADAATTSIT